MQFFDIDSVFFTVLNYPMSYLEFFGTVAGAIAVVISARANVWSWPIGIINVVLLFFLFYQVQLYPDMLLQIFFLVTNIMGWWRWKHPSPGEENKRMELMVSLLSERIRYLILMSVLIATVLMGSVASQLSNWLPSIFTKPSAFPYLDSFVTVVSIVAQYLMLQKKVECWILWIMADVVATYLYFSKDIKFLGLEYLVFCFIAAYGFWHWRNEFRETDIFIKQNSAT
jgi:nicotinamide mononucleotide transporter